MSCKLTHLAPNVYQSIDHVCVYIINLLSLRPRRSSILHPQRLFNYPLSAPLYHNINFTHERCRNFSALLPSIVIRAIHQQLPFQYLGVPLTVLTDEFSVASLPAIVSPIFEVIARFPARTCNEGVLAPGNTVIPLYTTVPLIYLSTLILNSRFQCGGVTSVKVPLGERSCSTNLYSPHSIVNAHLSLRVHLPTRS